jgi:hypothetical protein
MRLSEFTSPIKQEGLRDPKDNPCWDGYKPVGTKKKNGKTVPNCVPENADVELAIKEHIRLNIPFSECLFRPGSDAFYEFYQTAKRMFAEGKLDVDWQDAELLGTDIGEFIMVEGERVPLDVPIEESESKQGVAEGSLETNTPNPVVVIQDLKGKILDKVNLSVAAQKYKLGNPQDIKKQLAHQNYTTIGNYVVVAPMTGQPNDVTTQDMAEAEYQGKDVDLNSPKRGGPKKFYVYVKNPKTGNVKKVTWGDTTGLKIKSGDPDRVRSFVARHKCKQANDKTTARYWACRTPRYKSLGVKGGAWW